MNITLKLLAVLSVTAVFSSPVVAQQAGDPLTSFETNG